MKPLFSFRLFQGIGGVGIAFSACSERLEYMALVYVPQRTVAKDDDCVLGPSEVLWGIFL